MTKIIRLILFLLLAAFGQTCRAQSHSVVLNWTPSVSPTVINYQVFRGVTSGGEGSTPIATSVAAGCTNQTTCTFTDSSILAGQTFYYFVESYDGTNLSVPSNEVSGTVPVNAATGLRILNSN